MPQKAGRQAGDECAYKKNDWENNFCLFRRRGELDGGVREFGGFVRRQWVIPTQFGY
jgi:hypothetical protein